MSVLCSLTTENLAWFLNAIERWEIPESEHTRAMKRELARRNLNSNNEPVDIKSEELP